MMKISSSLEDYLEAISEIIAVNGHAHTKDIAEKLNVKMPSVTNALQALSARGLIRYQSHSPVVLTASGAETAAVIRRRHSTLETFFTEVLKLDAAEADGVACKIEHVIGEKVISRFGALCDAIANRDDCAPLREHLAQLMPQLCVEDPEELVPLGSLDPGESAVISRVGENLRGLKKFADLGLVNGTFVQVEGIAPLGDLIRLKVLDSCLSIRKADAQFIWVKKTV